MARKISPGVYFGLYDKTALAEYVPAFVNPIKPKKAQSSCATETTGCGSNR